MVLPGFFMRRRFVEGATVCVCPKRPEGTTRMADRERIPVVVLTSDETRHRYFVRRMAEAFDVRGALHERTGYHPAADPPSDLSERERHLLERHFADRAAAEEAFFGGVSAPLGEKEARVLELSPGSLNSPETLAFVQRCEPRAVLVYGTNLIRDPLLRALAGRMVNLHLGLSPYYRGTATNFYPLLNEEPEYVGATIHLIDAGIDSGAILAHARPRIESGDGPHDIGCKAIEAGAEKLISILPAWLAGEREPVPQWVPERPRVYLRRDYHPRQVAELYDKLAAGMLDRYLARVAASPPALRLMD